MSSKGVRAGQAYVEIGADDKQLDLVLKNDIAKLQNWSGSVATLSAKVLAVGVASATGLGFALSKASEFEQTLGKFDSIFGSLSEANKAWADDLAKQFHRSRQEVFSFLADTQAVIVPLGFEAGAAETMSRTLTKLAIDVATFHNKQDADVIRDFRSALTGESETMKKYGVIVNETAVKQELLNRGFDINKVSEAEKVQARYNIILRSTAVAQGATIRESTTFEGVWRALRAATDDLAITVGSKLLPVVKKIVGPLAAAVQASAEWLDQNGHLVENAGILTAVVLGGGTALFALAGAIRITAAALAAYRVVTQSAAAAQAVLLALQGPKGWLTLAVAAGVATVAVAGVYNSLSSAEPALKRAETQLDQTAQAQTRLNRAIAAQPKQTAADVEKMFTDARTPAEKLRQELEALNKARDEFVAGNEQGTRTLDGFDRALVQLRESAINAGTGIYDAMSKARDEIRLLKGQTTESELELEKMARNGAPQALIEQYRQLQAAREKAKSDKEAAEKRDTERQQQIDQIYGDARSSAARIAQETMTPEEQRQQQVQELQRLRFNVDPTTGKSFIDQRTYERAMQKLDEQAKPDAKQIRQQTQTATTGNDLRSEAGARDLLALFNNGQGKAADVTAKEALKHTLLLKKIKDGVTQPGPQTVSLS